MKAPAINLEEGAKFKANIAMDSKHERQSTLREFPLSRERNLPTKTWFLLERMNLEP